MWPATSSKRQAIWGCGGRRGLLYQQGYFRQVIDRFGSQQALFPYNDPGQLPVMPVREPNGEWLRLEVVFARLLSLVACLAGPGGESEAVPFGQQ